MFRGYNKPKKSDIFGPSSSGGSLARSYDRELYMKGEGIGSFFSSIFRKLIPAASKTIKKIAGSSIVRDTGKQLLDSGVNAAVNVAADAIGGDKQFNESISDELSNARKEIASALKKANSKRKATPNIEFGKTIKKPRGKPKKVTNYKKKKKRSHLSVFDDDD